MIHQLLPAVLSFADDFQVGAAASGQPSGNGAVTAGGATSAGVGWLTLQGLRGDVSALPSVLGKVSAAGAKGVSEMVLVLNVGAPTTLKIDGLRRADNDTYLNDATITFAIKVKSTGAAVGTGTGSLTYQAASNGNYRGNVSAGAALAVDGQYVVEFTITGPTYSDFRKVDAEAQYHGRIP